MWCRNRKLPEETSCMQLSLLHAAIMISFEFLSSFFINVRHDVILGARLGPLYSSHDPHRMSADPGFLL